MNEATQNPIFRFANDIINGTGGLRDFERHELAAENYDHDVCVALWTIRCLANPRNESSGPVLDAIIQRREIALRGGE